MLAPQGSTTRLPLALIFALASRPARDPIVHLTGGWATWSCVEAQLPVDVLTAISHVSLGDVEICCDHDHHVFNAEHTDSEVAAALRGTHWFEVHEWVTSGPGASSSNAA